MPVTQFTTQADLSGGRASGTSTVLINAAGSASGAGTANAITKQGKPHAYVVSGTFVGTVKVQVSMDNSTWYDLASYTAPAVLESTGPWAYVRGNVSAWTSGAITLTKISF